MPDICLLHAHFLSQRVCINFSQHPGLLDQFFQLLFPGLLQADLVFIGVCSFKGREAGAQLGGREEFYRD